MCGKVLIVFLCFCVQAAAAAGSAAAAAAAAATAACNRKVAMENDDPLRLIFKRSSQIFIVCRFFKTAH